MSITLCSKKRGTLAFAGIPRFSMPVFTLLFLFRFDLDRGILDELLRLLLRLLTAAEEEERACTDQDDNQDDRADDRRLVPEAERNLNLRRLARDEGLAEVP